MKPRPRYLGLATLFCILCLHPSSASEPKHWEIPFGTTLPEDGALHGKIYQMPLNARLLPDFESLHPKGDFYAYSLSVKNQNTFPWHGLPGSEWYAIDYRGVFWLQKETRLHFRLYSDDGSKLYIDDKCVIDNDGVHSFAGRGSFVRMKPGLHHIRVSYFQGPAPYVGLVLAVKPKDEDLKPFDLREYPLPAGASAQELEQRPH